MDDLISRSALLAAYDKAHHGPPGGARDLIKNAPDAIVRCKDCMYWSKEEYYHHCIIRQGWFPVKPDWFCADGERR